MKTNQECRRWQKNESLHIHVHYHRMYMRAGACMLFIRKDWRQTKHQTLRPPHDWGLGSTACAVSPVIWWCLHLARHRCCSWLVNMFQPEAVTLQLRDHTNYTVPAVYQVCVSVCVTSLCVSVITGCTSRYGGLSGRRRLDAGLQRKSTSRSRV